MWRCWVLITTLLRLNVLGYKLDKSVAEVLFRV